MRGFGDRPVRVTTRDGLTLVGALVQSALQERSVVALLAAEDDAQERIIIPIDSIATIEER